MPAPTMLATTTKIAIARPNSAGIDSFSTVVASPDSIASLNSDIIATIEDGKKSARTESARSPLPALRALSGRWRGAHLRFPETQEEVLLETWRVGCGDRSKPRGLDLFLEDILAGPH